MIKTFTHEDVLLYAYNENTHHLNEIEAAISKQDDLLDWFVSVEKAKSLLDALCIAPTRDIDDAVLAYATVTPH